ncbi:hypothetical protein FXO38_36466 [Capsicum annuum]|nr:hypothetical protein FXO38_36466 [Capsicum annuum]KAF3685011.1 hypothetical protein FXO37_01046 [Capsicum annuum]
MFHEPQHSFVNRGLKFSSVEVDLPAMMEQKDKAVSNLTRGIEGLFKNTKVNYVKGYGKFLSTSGFSVYTVQGGHSFGRGKNTAIATGSDVKADIVPTMDGEVRKQFQHALEKQKMKFMLQTKVVSVDITGDGVKLTLKPASDGHQTTLEADVVLVSAGRVSFTSEPGLDMIGVETDKVCRMLVNECFASNASGVHAIGAVVPEPMLAHKAQEDGGHYRAKAIDAEEIVKVIAEKESGEILGVYVMSPNAGDLIHEAVLALQYGTSSEDIAHPTMSEALKEAVVATYDKPIHM